MSLKGELMKIYDITQELFSCEVYPGDTPPSAKPVLRISGGDACNLTDINMCLHNGTHIDAPYHFFDGAKTADEIELCKCLGAAVVREFSGCISAEAAAGMLDGDPERLLIKGASEISAEAARVFTESSLMFIGVEPQSVSDAESTTEVHRILLAAEIVIAEGLSLSDVPCGEYFLSALPLKLGGADGSPCRAVLIKPD